MAENVGAIVYDARIDTTKLKSDANSVEKIAKDTSDNITNIGSKMTLGITAPIVAGFGLAIKYATDLNETINKVDVAFKNRQRVLKTGLRRRSRLWGFRSNQPLTQRHYLAICQLLWDSTLKKLLICQRA